MAIQAVIVDDQFEALGLLPNVVNAELFSVLEPPFARSGWPNGTQDLVAAFCDWIATLTGPCLLMLDMNLGMSNVDAVAVAQCAVGTTALRPLAIVVCSSRAGADDVQRVRNVVADANDIYFDDAHDSLLAAEAEKKRAPSVRDCVVRAGMWLDDQIAGGIVNVLRRTRSLLSNGNWALPFGNGLFPEAVGARGEKFHSAADWAKWGQGAYDSVKTLVHQEMSRLLDACGVANADTLTPCDGLGDCWHIWALKSVWKSRLHRGLVLAVATGSEDWRGAREGLGWCAVCGAKRKSPGDRACGELVVEPRLMWPWHLMHLGKPQPEVQAAEAACGRTLAGLRRLRAAGWTYSRYYEGRRLFGVELKQAFVNPTNLALATLGINERGVTTKGFASLPMVRNVAVAIDRGDLLATLWFEEDDDV